MIRFSGMEIFSRNTFSRTRLDCPSFYPYRNNFQIMFFNAAMSLAESVTKLMCLCLLCRISHPSTFGSCLWMLHLQWAPYKVSAGAAWKTWEGLWAYCWSIILVNANCCLQLLWSHPDILHKSIRAERGFWLVRFDGILYSEDRQWRVPLKTLWNYSNKLSPIDKLFNNPVGCVASTTNVPDESNMLQLES